MIRKAFRIILSLVFVGSIWFPAELVAKAEETAIAGYHEYVTTEEEAIDHWYAVARGTYLKDGTCGITRAGTGKMSVSATTTAHSVCDYVRASVDLHESEDGGSSYGQNGSWYCSESQTSSCHGSKANISVTSGWKYYASGAHSVTEGSTTESTTTHTDALKAS